MKIEPTIKPLISIPWGSRIFLLEDDPVRIEWFSERLWRDCDVTLAESAPEALRVLERSEGLFDIMFLDHDLAIEDQSSTLNPAHERDSGSYVVKWMVDNHYPLADFIVIHSWNPGGARNMLRILSDATVLPIHIMPFYSFDIEVV